MKINIIKTYLVGLPLLACLHTGMSVYDYVQNPEKYSVKESIYVPFTSSDAKKLRMGDFESRTIFDSDGDGSADFTRSEVLGPEALRSVTFTRDATQIEKAYFAERRKNY